MAKKIDYAEKLKNLADKNEVRIDDHKGRTNSPQHFYQSLRNAFHFYFNTFRTNNATYDSYISSTSIRKRKHLEILERQYLDVENTVLCIVSFERFFELFLKDLLKKTHIKLTYSENHTTKDTITKIILYKKSKSTWQLVQKIQSNTFQPYKSANGKGINTIPFRETLDRFYDLLKSSKESSKKTNRLIKKFITVIKPFPFLDNNDHRGTFEFINWYRDRILHKGNKLPTLRFLDYIITQRVLPITNQILALETNFPEGWLFFTKTVSGIKIFEEMVGLKFVVRNPKTNKQIRESFHALLYLGHLKELGRANMNMNIALKENRSTYEYNYKDTKGRGKRFATTERENHPEASKQIKKCPCCAEESLVLYIIYAKDQQGSNNEDIEWLKCYTCDYHLRYNVFDLHYFDTKFDKHFSYQLGSQTSQ